jgi:ABC-type Fe3+/spermidine/putrescine transport system ATPase subunit
MMEIKDLSINLGDFSLSDVNLTIGEGEYFVILGPTGAGKTVLLEGIAGLRPLKKGEIWVSGNNVTALPPEGRNMGYVPQDYVLFPYLNVAENLAFGLKQKRYSKDEMSERMKSLADLLDLSHLLNRDTLTLSGGEKQRVALARALSTEPRTLLLDEPLIALDPGLKHKLWWELKKLQISLKVTLIHVTHDFEEALVLADRIVVLNNGKIAQVDIPEKVFRKPRSRFVAEFLEVENIYKGRIVEREGRFARIALENEVDIWGITEADNEVFASVRPEDITLTRDNNAPYQTKNALVGEVSAILNRGILIQVVLDVGLPFVSLITRQAYLDLGLNIGAKVGLLFNEEDVHIF